jgi:hypothetical protein
MQAEAPGSATHISYDFPVLIIDTTRSLHVAFTHASRQSDCLIAKKAAVVIKARVRNADDL